jgi:iron complex transport system substrate-binding protein
MRLRLPLAVAAVAALLASGCAGDDAPTEPADTTNATGGDYPVTVGDVTLTEQPTAIVSLSPTVTEMLFAIGAGSQVVAVDEFSNYPPEAPTTDLSGYTPNAEAIATYEPDLVVISSYADDLVPQLTPLGIPVHVAPDTAVTLDDVYTQIEELGALTGRRSEAEALVDEITTEIEELVAQVPEREEPLTYYYELDDQLYTVTSESFVGTLLSMVGLESIADAHDVDGTGYPQLSAEIVVQSDPDVIFLADTKCCGQSAETVAARDGWGELTAVQEGHIVELDDDIASRWGPRIVELLRLAVDAVTRIS